MSAPVFGSVLEAIGGTPLIRLAGLGRGLPAPIYAKVEFLSIGGSVKDRAALAMVEQAERDGVLRAGGTIVEATSGNTGIGLAVVGRQRGYRVVVGVSDRAAREKSDILRAYGAEVVLAPTSVPKQDPAHLFNVVRRLVAETPGAWLANQYDNPANPAVHRRTTGPEIWAQTGGRVTFFVAGIGTGGTITGTGDHLHTVSDGAVTVVGADPESSVFGGGDGSPYFVESIGQFVHPRTTDEQWPQAYRPDVVDRFERIPDRESLLTARRLAREEGLLAGPSSGTALAAALRVAATARPDDLVVVLLPDSGRSYLSTLFDDGWLRRLGFLDEPLGEPLVADLLPAVPPLVTASSTDPVGAALAAAGSAPAVPVVLARRGRPYGVAGSEVLGWFDPAALRAAVEAGRVDPGEPVTDHLSAPLPTVGVGQPLAAAATALPPDRPAALVLRDGRAVALLTHDVLERARRRPG